jgi:hypothetical protein
VVRPFVPFVVTGRPDANFGLDHTYCITGDDVRLGGEADISAYPQDLCS